MDTPTPAAAATQMDRTARVQQLLHSLLIVSAELGPDFIHSAHGTTLLQQAMIVIASVGGAISAVK